MAGKFYITDGYYVDLRSHVLNDISYAKCKANGEWYRAPIQKKSINRDGVIEVILSIDGSAGDDVTITEIELHSANNECIGVVSVSIAKSRATEEILYMIRMRLLADYVEYDPDIELDSPGMIL